MKVKKERWPNFLTSGNLMCGVLALALLTRGHALVASWLIIAAIIFDFLDGKIARMLGVSGNFGKEFDSLADIVSFGAAPAILMYVYALNKYAIFGALVGVVYVICGALRLARFNLMKSRPYFLG
ncbi:MAG: CDP-diacylglycerol--serine O-phosphatidyltransferase, partial [Chloroflexi bacterium]|nr:CDP-diacylglycerol--serine O-phosphatidyltransferase [Chloroflexota bacterium]